MIKPNFTGFVSEIKTTLSERSPEILMGIGIAGMLTTTVLAVSATPKALDLIEDIKREENRETLTPIETVKAVWKCYIPAATTCVMSTACLIGAGSVHAKRNAALATAYKMTETAFTAYKEKVVETIGEKKERVVRENVDKDRVDGNPVTQNTIIMTDRGNTLCYDYYSSRYFRSDKIAIDRAVNELNRRLFVEDYVSLNEFYDEIGLNRTPTGDELGWRVDRGLIELEFTSQLADNDEPCMVISHRVEPRYDYSRCT